MKPLRALILEDMPDDLELVVRELRQGGFDLVFENYQTAADMRAALGRGRWDVILADYSMPGFKAPAALEILHESGLDIPFIIVSGAIGETSAAMVMKAGAHDYVAKDNMARLVPAIERELREAATRRARHEAEAALAESETRLHAVFDNSRDAISLSKDDSHVLVNPAYVTVFGFSSAGELIGRPTIERVAPAERARVQEITDRRARGDAVPSAYETRGVCKDGTEFDMELGVSQYVLGGESYTLVLLRDITERKQAEEALRQSEERLRLKLDSVLSPDAEIEDQELANILDVPALQSLMDDLHKVTGIGIGVRDLEGNELVHTGWQDICTKFHRVRPVTRGSCDESDRLFAHSLGPGEYRAYQCLNGLWDIVTPVFVGGKQVGNVYFGQFFYDDEVPDREVFVAQAERCGFDKGKYLAAFDCVPRWSRSRVESLARFLTEFSWLLSRLSYGNLKLAKTLLDRARAEEARRASETRYTQLVECMSSGVSVYAASDGGNDFVFKDFSHGAELIDGVRREDVIGRNVRDVFPGVVEFGLFDVLRRVWRTGTPERHPTALYKDERIASWRENYVYRLPSGEVVAVYDDVTEQKLADAALAESEEQNRVVVEHAAEAIVVIQDGLLKFANPAAARMIGRSLDELADLPFPEFIHPEDRVMVVERHHLRLRGEPVPDRYEFRIVRPTGEVRLVEVGAALFDWLGRPAMLSFLIDITDRKRAAEELRAEQARAQEYLDIASVMLIAMDTTGVVTLINRRGCEVLGWPEQEVLGKDWFATFLPERTQTNMRVVFRRLLAGEPVGPEYSECLVLTRSGEERVIAWHDQLLHDESGIVTGILSSGDDVTERKRAEEELGQRTDDMAFINRLNVAANRGAGLPELQEQVSLDLRSMFGLHNAVFYSLTPDRRWLVPNGLVMPPEAQADVRQLTGAEMPELRVDLAVPNPYGEVLESRQPRLFTKTADLIRLAESFSGQPHVRRLATKYVTALGEHSVLLIPLSAGDEQFGLVELAKSGTLSEHDVARLRVLGEQFNGILDRRLKDEQLKMYGRHLELMVEERTNELKATQQSLVRHEKLATLGRVAGSVAHELRNPLGAIRNASFFLQQTATDRLEGKQLRHLQLIDEYIERANRAITAILDFTQGRQTQRAVCAVRPILDRAIVDAALPKGVDVRLKRGAALPHVLVDDEQMVVVFRNLLTNAAQAMAGHGMVRVAATRRDDFVDVAIADSGAGITPENMARLFEPLFTTKDIGVGLGLAICRGIDKGCGGSIDVQSEVDKGTTFTVSLPVAPECPRAAPDANGGPGRSEDRAAPPPAAPD